MYITVESEDPSSEVEATDQPVEEGIDVTDHIRPKPRTMNISGVIVGETAAQTRETILKLQTTGSMIEFVGRNYFQGVITQFQSTHDYKVANGLSFTATLKEIRVARSSYVETLPAPIRAQVAPVISSGRKQITEKKKTGTKGGKSIWEE
ncbi:hypothetical protein HQN90_17825 [Paenibacillus alba]|uniref:phage baseplate protein n=1 Tax=Paenibacillus alba TaxID=1197127 RepID=UPI00156642EB|nr:hypothetical protein [Paenibacillus alba]NQX67984.1 hypothetical protein [Paenibacillus alba]